MSKKIIAYGNGKTGYLEGDKVIKAFDSDYSKADVLNEALNHARIEETGLNVPEIKGVEMLDGHWVIVKEYIKGRTLAELMEEYPEKEEEYLELFIRTQKLIHSKRSPELRKQFDRLSDRIAQSSIEATQRFSLLQRMREMPRHKKVCHGDFNPSNVIVKDNGEVFVIDWSHASQGNAAADAAQTYLLFLMDGKRELAEKYIEAFCKTGTTKREYIEKWLPIAAAAQMIRETGSRKELLAGIANDNKF